MFKGLLPESPGANIKEFLVTIISEVKRPQTQCLSPKGEFWVCSETNCRMVRNSFQRAKVGLGKSMVKNESYDESIPFYLEFSMYLMFQGMPYTPCKQSPLY
jgi:hypothetical protein